MRRNTYIAVIVTILALCLSSCGTRKQVPSTRIDSPEELSRRFGMRITPKDNLILYTEASHWLDVPHRIGGNSKRGVDCSHFVANIYRDVYDKRVGVSSADILKKNCKKIRRGSLREGDLVFFRTDGGKKKEPNHVGIYLKNERFVHASTSKGVMVSSLNEPYYLRAWMTGGRVK